MAREFTIKQTSRNSANLGEDIVISNPDEVNTARNRRILRAQLVDNSKDASASIKAEIALQRRSLNGTAWEDATPFNPAHLKAGQEIRLCLTAGQTRRMYDALTQLYQVPIEGWEKGQEKRYSVVDSDLAMVISGRERVVIQTLLEQEGPRLWEIIEELQPDLLKTIAIKRDHETKQRAVDEFRERLDEDIPWDDPWSEDDWEQFFKRNTWIFGHNLIYQFVRTVANQPRYADPDVFGRDGQRGDVLLATEARARFTLLVDLKKPSTPLVLEKKYRNQVHYLSPDLIGGVAQLQSNVTSWAVKASTDIRTYKQLDSKGIHTYEPRSILIVGNLASVDSDDKLSTFEHFRRNLKSPEIITYDELLARAEFALRLQQEEM